jgi:hypothetical protein
MAFAETAALALIEEHNGVLVSIISEPALEWALGSAQGGGLGGRLAYYADRRDGASIPQWWHAGCLMPVFGTCR